MNIWTWIVSLIVASALAALQVFFQQITGLPPFWANVIVAFLSIGSGVAAVEATNWMVRRYSR